ncbi:PAS domain S-box-containing protein [Methylobacterium phyllostachyos]|uniref:Blue-light-activated histidine kinase n=1 Tax=Methylobacterium phyllostachyos TaxID=582672 RepID=A0A1G9VC00_9HYPH|nr:PAS domain S-box protein [Methylobacterium phyllostachyos]SDM69689.1 PAS domain S-box-containing protein [Methylobacterium phyllostachyos]
MIGEVIGLPIGDEARLNALDAFAILDTPPERGFDDIVHLARRLCDVPVALVSLVDRDRQWFKARAGFPPCETDLDRSVCKFALAEPGLLQIPDLTRDARTRDNPLVTGEPYLRFYAGAPLRTPEGHALGSLCVIDHAPRPGGLTPAQAEDLTALARQVMDQLLLRRSLVERDAMIRERRASQHERDVLGATQADVAGAGGEQDVVLGKLLEGAMGAVPAADGAALELVDGQALEYRAVRGSLTEHKGLHVPLADSSSGRTFTTNSPLLVTDARADTDVRQDTAASLDIGSAIHVPVTRGDAVLGVLKLQSRHADAFGERDLALLRMFAATATSALTQVSEAAAQAAVRAGEARYRAVFESIVDYAIVVMDPDGRVTDWNAGAEKILGWTADEMQGRPADVFFTPEDRDAGIAEREMQTAMTEGTGNDERWHLRKGGERFFALGVMMVLRDDAGTATGFVKVLRDRTDQRLAEEKLRQSDERLQMALTASGGVGLWDWVVESDLLHGDAQFARLYGLDADEVAAGVTMERYQTFVVPDDIAPLRAAIRNTFDYGADFLVEYRLAVPGRPLRWVECRGSLIHDEAGVPLRFSGTAVDISARKAAEEEVSKLAAIVAQSRDFVGFATPDGRADFVNEAGRRLVGLPDLAAARATRILDYFVPEERQRLVVEVLPAAQRDNFWEGELHFRNFATGAAVPVHYNVFPVRDAAGDLLGYGTVTRDLTEERRNRESLRASETSLRAVLDTVPVGILFAEAPSGRIVGGNKRLEEIFRHPVLPSPDAESYGEWVAFHEDGRRVEPHEYPLSRIIRDGAEQAALECQYQRGDGTRVWIEIVGVPMRDADGAMTGGVVAVADVDDRRKAQAHQDLLNHELSHRMKNLLAMVQAIAASTLRGATDIDAARDVLGSRLVALGKAHDMLLGGAAESAPLAAVVREGVGVQEAAGARVSFTGPNVEIGGKAALSLALTLHELTTNAVKYGALSVPEGRVSLTASLIQAEDGPDLRLAWTESGGPPVVPPSRKGFGSRLIERGLTAQVGARLALAYPRAGATCVIEAPLANFQSMQ